MQKEKLLFLGGPLHEQFHDLLTSETTIYVFNEKLLTKAMMHQFDYDNNLTASQIFKHCYKRMAFTLYCGRDTTNCIYYYMEYVGYNKYEYFFTKEQEFFDNLFKGVK